MKYVVRRHLSMPGLSRLASGEFERILDPADSRGTASGDYPLSGLAVFLLKLPSLPQFDTDARAVRSLSLHNF